MDILKNARSASTVPKKYILGRIKDAHKRVIRADNCAGHINIPFLHFVARIAHLSSVIAACRVSYVERIPGAVYFVYGFF